MTNLLKGAVAGAIMLGGLSAATTEVSAMPVGALAPVAGADGSTSTAIDKVYWRYGWRGYGWRGGYGWRRPFYGYGFRRPFYGYGYGFRRPFYGYGYGFRRPFYGYGFRRPFYRW